MLVSLLGGGLTQQALVLTGIGWLGMLMLGLQSDVANRRSRVLEGIFALLAVAAIVACTLLLGMMPHSDAALIGGASLFAGALVLRAVRHRVAERRRRALVPATIPAAWEQPVEEHVA